jgi:carboxylesterase type B
MVRGGQTASGASWFGQEFGDPMSGETRWTIRFLCEAKYVNERTQFQPVQVKSDKYSEGHAEAEFRVSA